MDVELSDEQELAVLGKRPEGIVDDEFELVDLTTDDVEHRGDGVVIGDGFRVLVLYLVGHLTCCHEFLDLCLDGGCALGNLLDELDVAGG